MAENSTDRINTRGPCLLFSIEDNPYVRRTKPLVVALLTEGSSQEPNYNLLREESRTTYSSIHLDVLNLDMGTNGGVLTAATILASVTNLTGKEINNLVYNNCLEGPRVGTDNNLLFRAIVNPAGTPPEPPILFSVAHIVSKLLNPDIEGIEGISLDRIRPAFQKLESEDSTLEPELFCGWDVEQLRGPFHKVASDPSSPGSGQLTGLGFPQVTSGKGPYIDSRTPPDMVSLPLPPDLDDPTESDQIENPNSDSTGRIETSNPCLYFYFLNEGGLDFALLTADPSTEELGINVFRRHRYDFLETERIRSGDLPTSLQMQTENGRTTATIILNKLTTLSREEIREITSSSRLFIQMFGESQRPNEPLLISVTHIVQRLVKSGNIRPENIQPEFQPLLNTDSVPLVADLFCGYDNDQLYKSIRIAADGDDQGTLAIGDRPRTPQTGVLHSQPEGSEDILVEPRGLSWNPAMYPPEGEQFSRGTPIPHVAIDYALSQPVGKRSDDTLQTTPLSDLDLERKSPWAELTQRVGPYWEPSSKIRETKPPLLPIREVTARINAVTKRLKRLGR